MDESTLTPQQRANRRALAAGTLSNLGAHQHILTQAIRFIPGGRTSFIGMVQRAMRNQDPDAIAWWNIYADLLPAGQQSVELDLVCEAAGVAPDRIMAVVVSTAMRFGADVADLVAATTHPSIVRQTVKSAMRIGGQHANVAQKDREFLLQHQKFIPTPKGTSVHVHASASAAAAAKSQPSVPTFSDSIQGSVMAHDEVQGELKTADRGRFVDADYEDE